MYQWLNVATVYLFYGAYKGAKKIEKRRKMKIIKIGNNEYKMQSSAYTQFAYRNKTSRSLLKDMQYLIEITQKTDENEFNLENLDPITELVLNMAYVMIEEADKTQVTDYDSFLKSIPSLYDNMDWVYQVIQLGCTPISGQLQNNN